MKKDAELRRDVLDELEWEPSLDAAGIGVAAGDGVVTLTGGVPSFAEKVTAERVAKRVHGVRAVANDIEVRPRGGGRRTDADIARAAADALAWKATVPEGRVKASVSEGWVTLEGEVAWNYQREAAEEAVRPLLGVRGVINQVVVRPRASAADVRSRIEAAFRRSAEVDARKVRVEACDGKVTLLGELESWAERQEADRTAWAAPGVTEVENLIVVRPAKT
jgi:osmotically-inducible protein OsmY